MISLLKIVSEAITSPKALILAGAPGAGKGFILRGLDLGGLKVLNIDDNFIKNLKTAGVSLNLKKHDAEARSQAGKAMAKATQQMKKEIIPSTIANKESFILDGIASSSNVTIKLKNELEEAGYDVFMLYVYTDLERSLIQNQDRFEKSDGADRSLAPAIVMKTWNDVTNNYRIYQDVFSPNFVSVANTLEDEKLNNIKDIIEKYLDPFRPTDTKPKTDKQKASSKARKEKLEQEIQDFLDSDRVSNIIDSSVSKDEAQAKIKNFLNG